MLDLFNFYVANSNKFEALLVGQNMINKNPGSDDCFYAYFSYLMKIVSEESNSDGKMKILETASSALDLYSANAVLNANVIEFIKQCDQEIRSKMDDVLKERNQTNSNALQLIENLCEKADSLTDINEYKKTINQIQAIDSRIKIDSLDDSQSKKYGDLTKRCAELDATKQAFFESQKNKAYNEKALTIYKKVYEVCSKAKSSFSTDMLREFFSFNLEKLSQPVLIYYNYVYSFIFSKLSDDEKFVFTKCAIKYESK